MVDTPTVGLNYGDANIPLQGGLVGSLLTALNTQLSNPDNGYVYTPYYKGVVPTEGDVTKEVLVVTTDPTVLLPDSIAAYVQDATVTGATVVGGSQNTSIAASNFVYTGAAGEVIGASGTGTITSTAANATIGVAGAYTVTGIGSGDVYVIDSAAGEKITALGSGNTFDVGGLGAGGITTINAAASGGGNTFNFTANADTAVGGTPSVVAKIGVADTVNANAGAATIYAGGSDLFFTTGGTGVYFGAQATSTFVGGGGSDTIVTSTTGDVIRSGASADWIISGGGSDTIASTTVAPTIFATTGSDSQYWNASVQGAKFIDVGANSTVYAAGSAGGNFYFASAAHGNTTLIGATAGSDTFVINGAGTATITIENYQASDTFVLNGFSAADNTAADTALASGSAVTLSNGTTISFVGNHPTTVQHVNPQA